MRRDRPVMRMETTAKMSHDVCQSEEVDDVANLEKMVTEMMQET